MKIKTAATCIASLAVIASVAGAQQRPPVRQIGPVVAKSSEALASIITVRPLSDGRVLVNDVSGRRVLLFDDALKTSIVVADSTSATSSAYGGRTGGLIAYRGDSSLFVDPASSSMLVIDPSGKIARVMSVPRTQDAGMLASAQAGAPGFDPKGRLIYRSFPRIGMPTFGPAGITAPPTVPESTAIVRIDLATRALDTVGFAKIPKIKFDMNLSDDGRMRITTQVNPLPVVDDWAVLTDGSVAFVRGTDYHVDWVNADGSKASAPKISFDWQRLTDEDKIAFIDSVKAARARLIASQPTPAGGTAGGPGSATGPGTGGGGGTAGGGGQQVTIRTGGGDAGGGIMGAIPAGLLPQVNFVPASELPDYKPPFFAGATRADADGNLWIRTIPTKSIPGGPVYDVINRKGELVDRVQVPLNTTIAGFGPSGTVYLALTENKVQYLEIAKAK
jgi:hypothetical protein